MREYEGVDNMNVILKFSLLFMVEERKLPPRN